MPNYPPATPNPNVQHHAILTMLRAGCSPTFPHCPDLDVDPAALITFLKLPTGTHVVTAQGHAVA